MESNEATCAAAEQARQAKLAAFSQHGTDADVIRFGATPVTAGDAPGYRDVDLVFDLTPFGDMPRPSIRTRISVRPEDGEAVVRHLTTVHRNAWDGHEPLDVRLGERRPTWIDSAR